MDTSKPLDLRIINVDKNDVSNTAR
jgi:hypothetical protein